MGTARIVARSRIAVLACAVVLACAILASAAPSSFGDEPRYPHSMTPREDLFTMSGTSQAAAVTSGIVALMLRSDPALTPDQVKCRLLASSRPALTSAQTLAYSVFQQGAGLVNAVAAHGSSATECANQGLDVGAEAGTEHFGGPANRGAAGNYYIKNMAGSSWGGAMPEDGFSWSGGFPRNEGYSWSEAYLWTSGYTCCQGYTWS